MIDLPNTTPPYTPEQSRVNPWFAINGDETLRVEYNLNEKSIVYDIGGYNGDWADAIYERYGCFIEVFEPVQEFVTRLEKRFNNNKKIKIHPVGLAGKTRESEISLEEASSSVVKHEGRSETIKLVAADEIIPRDKKIGLMKMNIEAGEYELLDNLISSGIVKIIENIQIQFHVFIDNADERRKNLHTQLSKTHELTYNYPYIWENWRIKK